MGDDATAAVVLRAESHANSLHRIRTPVALEHRGPIRHVDAALPLLWSRLR